MFPSATSGLYYEAKVGEMLPLFVLAAIGLTLALRARRNLDPESFDQRARQCLKDFLWAFVALLVFEGMLLLMPH